MVLTFLGNPPKIVNMIYPRKIYPLLKNECSNRNIVVLTGSHQVGKTTILKMLESEFKSQNKPTLFFGFRFG
jgi:predicted AAA+ superfamily ATPase